MYDEADLTPLEDARNLGPVSAAELGAVGVHSLEALRRMGWEEAFERWARAVPARLDVNACAALIGALEDVDWRQLSPAQKAKARRAVRDLRGT
ncbi:MAG: TfoX/Sxy family DNA transformation protein [Planctomycetota bacterium]|jgi:hypothetical protein